MTGVYVCDSCSFRSPKWMGFCPRCRGGGGLRQVSSVALPSAVSLAAAGLAAEDSMRVEVGIAEFDRVLGGGLVAGAAILIGGEPGVGKSTLLLQCAAALASGGRTVLVASAEESARQIALRAGRLGLREQGVLLLADADVDRVIATAEETRPDLVVVDSIQTVTTREAEGTAGGTAQVRESAARLVSFAKASGVPVVLIGHVTKDGNLAGPKLLEHMVDVVLYLEGDEDRGLRFLRSLKNRFGAVHQVGLFDMREAGMVEIEDPAAVLVGDRCRDVAGTVLFPALDGRRPLMLEVQALVSKSRTQQPRRSVKGIEPARIHQILAVLERHAELSFADRDIYVNVVGGIKLREPAADLPAAVALASSLLEQPVGDLAAWGEVGLTGEIRSVSGGERRLHETRRLHLTRVVAPDGHGPRRIADALVDAGLGISRRTGPVAVA